MHVISRSQTETDHEAKAPPGFLATGVAWRWWGRALRVDGPADLLRLQDAHGSADLQRRAARKVHRLPGMHAAAPAPCRDPDDDDLPPGPGMVVTDGHRAWPVLFLSGGDLLLFPEALPPAGAELWVARLTGGAPATLRPPRAAAEAVICFTPGTRIATPGGARPVEALCPGDRIQTADDGPQPVLWRGACRLSGARLFAHPDLRPIRLRAAALGADRPDADLLVSPAHRVMLRGPAARALFGAAEVLVRAADLCDDRGIARDHALREVTYVHLMLERHQIIWANGVATETFRPGPAVLAGLAPGPRIDLLAACPALAHDPHAYGDPARDRKSVV